MYPSKTLILEKGNIKLYKCSVMASSYFLVECNGNRYIRRCYKTALALVSLFDKTINTP